MVGRSCGPRPRACGGRYRSCGTTTPVSIGRSCSRPRPVVSCAASPCRAGSAPRCGCGDLGRRPRRLRDHPPGEQQRRRPCHATTCPPPCAVSDKLNACQAKALLAIVADLADPQAVVVLGGDLNAKVDEPTPVAIRAAGFADTHVLAHNAECDPATGEQCTSGRDDTSLATSPTRPAARPSASTTCSSADPRVRPGRPDRAVRRRSARGRRPDGPGVPLDHTGVEATLACRVDDAARQAAQTAPTLPPAPTTTLAPGQLANDATRAAVTEAFRNLFDGDVSDVNRKLSWLKRTPRMLPRHLPPVVRGAPRDRRPHPHPGGRSRAHHAGPCAPPNPALRRVRSRRVSLCFAQSVHTA